MGSYAVNYNVANDTYHLAYRPEDDFPGMQSEGMFSDGELVPEGSWTAFLSPYAIDINSGIGITLKLDSGELLELIAHPQPPADTEQASFVPFPGRQITLRVEHDEGIIRYSWSEDRLETWAEVASFSPSSPVSEVGVVLRYDNEAVYAAGQAGQARLLTGIWQNVVEEVWLAEPEEEMRRAARAGAPQVGVQSTSEPYVHTIVGGQFGDLEFDIGKSVRWITWFCDNVFVLDVNLGTQRYWVVNWAETFPDAKHSVTGINYFVLPVEYRKEQWRQYKLAFGEPADDEWILFLDGHEGLGVDNRSLPDDYAFAPFKSFLWREIQRAQDLGQPYAVLPYYVFLRSDHIVNVTYETVAMDTEGLVLPVQQAISTPYYQPYQGLKRLWNAAELKKTNFDWTQLDVPVAPSAAAKLQILSYGYAHWNLQDIEPPATEVPALTEANDDGWRMRNLLSKVRPVPSLPYGDTYRTPDADPAGLAGPWACDDTNNPDPVDPITGDPMTQPVTPDPSLLGLVTPLYDNAFRLNMRDGVWYEQGLSGNIPLKWDDERQIWTTDYDPAEWSSAGVKSYDPTAVP